MTFARALLSAKMAILGTLVGSLPAVALDLTVNVYGLTEPGRVLAAVCSSGFLLEQCPYGGSAEARADGTSVRVRIAAPGAYAVAVFQDLNGNGQLDRDRAGLPVEPYGFSNGVGRSAPPRFARAAFMLESDKTISVTLTRPRQ